LSEIDIVALSALVLDGVKEIAIVQLSPTASEEPQLFDVEKSAAFGPLTVTPAIEIAAVPGFESITACAALFVPET
jgi:hypothetical protein